MINLIVCIELLKTKSDLIKRLFTLVDETTKGFMKELIEFISLIRASEKERYDVQKQFMNDTINTIKDISESIKASGEYMRTSIEKLKEILTNGINTIRKEVNIDTIVDAKNVLGETIDVLQKETQLHTFKQTMQDIRESIEKLQEKKLALSIKELQTVQNIDKTQIDTPQKPQVSNSPEKKKESISVKMTASEKEKEKKTAPKSKKETFHIDF